MIKPYPQWTKEEQESLWLRTAAGDQSARNQIIEGNLPLVRMVAGRFHFPSGQKDDLVQVGAIGLIKAVDGFDLKKCCCFSTYAVPYILGEMRHYAQKVWERKEDEVKIYRKIERLRAEYREKHFAEPTMKELADALEMAGEELAFLLEAAKEKTALQEVRDQRAEEDFNRVEERESLHSALVDLAPRGRYSGAALFSEYTAKGSAAHYHEPSTGEPDRKGSAVEAKGADSRSLIPAKCGMGERDFCVTVETINKVAGHWRKLPGGIFFFPL